MMLLMEPSKFSRMGKVFYGFSIFTGPPDNYGVGGGLGGKTSYPIIP